LPKLAALLLLLTIPAAAQSAKDIDPFLGTENAGNTFPGPSVPWGMIKPGPDDGDNKGNPGWKATGDINGFSQVHTSGTGGGAKYGNLLIQPTTGEPQTTGFSSPRANEQATVGLYSVTLTRYPIDVAITSTRRSALYKFTYPAGQKHNLLFDMAHVLSAEFTYGEAQIVVHSSIHIDSPTEVAGYQSVIGGWNKQTTPYTVYFYAVTNTPAATFGTWHQNELAPNSTQNVGGIREGNGAYLTFAANAPTTIYLKFGISFISEKQARQNALSEIPAFDFDRVHAESLALWDKALANLTIKGASDEDRSVLASAMYHTMLMPVDRTGENPLWHSTEPYYDDFFTVWDTFRTSSPLLDLIAPKREDQIVRSMIDTYKHEGWLPDGRSGNVTGRVQGGSDPDYVIADAYLHHLPNIDWNLAYQAIVKDAEVEPPDQIQEGRGDLQEWQKLGYLSIEGADRPSSRTMETAGADYAIAVVAKGLHHEADYAKYLKRSGNWQNLWDKDAADAGFTGWIWSRHKDGSWKAPFDAYARCSWGGDTFYEGNTWTYSLFVPQDVAKLIQLAGGNQSFINRLDAFFSGAHRFDVNNEPGFLSPYLYNWAGDQSRSAYQVRQILAKSFHAGRKGLPGNDDSGAMSSWYIFSRLGFFPNAGQDVYLIGSPAYPEATIHLGNGRTFTVIAKNVSAENMYIASAQLNGKPLTQSWFRIEDIEHGGTLTLTMTSTPTHWDTGAPPPSTSH
jgi:predicted alpha-1,2-mannosidase